MAWNGLDWNGFKEIGRIWNRLNRKRLDKGALKRIGEITNICCGHSITYKPTKANISAASLQENGWFWKANKKKNMNHHTCKLTATVLPSLKCMSHPKTYSLALNHSTGKYKATRHISVNFIVHISKGWLSFEIWEIQDGCHGVSKWLTRPGKGFMSKLGGSTQKWKFH